MQQTMQPKIINVQENETTCEISLRPLERGLGATVGEVMTRLMYDTLAGCKLSKVVIMLEQQLVLDMHTALPTQETLEEIILNLQDVIFESDAPFGQYVFFLAPTRQAIVTAADLILDEHTRILNPTQLLYHYTGESHAPLFEIQLTMTKATGHLSHPTMLGKDGFYLDACFSPVLNCTYKVLDTRVEESTDFNELLLSITLQNNHDIQAVFTEVLDNLQAQIQYFLHTNAGEAKASSAAQSLSDHEDISALKLSLRTLLCLKKHAIHTLHDLVSKTKSDLLQLPHFGAKSLIELETQLHLVGYTLTA